MPALNASDSRLQSHVAVSLLQHDAPWHYRDTTAGMILHNAMETRAVFQHTHAPSCLSARNSPLQASRPICCAGVRVSRPCPDRNLVLRPTCCRLPQALHLVLHPSCWALVWPHPGHHQVWRPIGLLLLVWPQRSPTRCQSRPWGASCRCSSSGGQ